MKLKMIKQLTTKSIKKIYWIRFYDFVAIIL